MTPFKLPKKTSAAKKSFSSEKGGLFEDTYEVSSSLTSINNRTQTFDEIKAECNRLKDEGCVHAEEGRHNEALKCFQSALDLEPANHVLYELRAQVLLSVGNYLDAIQLCKASIEISPNWSESHLTLARCYREFGEIYYALESLQRALELDPLNQEVIVELEEMREITSKADELRLSYTTRSQHCGISDENEVHRCMHNLTSRATVREFSRDQN